MPFFLCPHAWSELLFHHQQLKYTTKLQELMPGQYYFTMLMELYCPSAPPAYARSVLLFHGQISYYYFRPKTYILFYGPQVYITLLWLKVYSSSIPQVYITLSQFKPLFTDILCNRTSSSDITLPEPLFIQNIVAQKSSHLYSSN